MQILEGDDGRLSPCAGQHPARHRRQLPTPQFLGRQLRTAVLPQGNVDQRRKQGRVFGCV
jgi:hypothetical protein